jgi:hypothetical protein
LRAAATCRKLRARREITASDDARPLPTPSCRRRPASMTCLRAASEVVDAGMRRHDGTGRSRAAKRFGYLASRPNARPRCQTTRQKPGSGYGLRPAAEAESAPVRAPGPHGNRICKLHHPWLRRGHTNEPPRRQDARKSGYPKGPGDGFEPSESWRLGGSFGRHGWNCRRPIGTWPVADRRAGRAVFKSDSPALAFSGCIRLGLSDQEEKHFCRK